MNKNLLPLVSACAALVFSSTITQAAPPAAGARGAGLAGRHGGDAKQHAAEVIAKFDKDGDKALNADELAAMFEGLRERSQQHAEKGGTAGHRPGRGGAATAPAGEGKQRAHGDPKQHAQMAVSKFDKNGDGKLDADELAALFTAFRERMQQHRGKGGTGTKPSATQS